MSTIRDRLNLAFKEYINLLKTQIELKGQTFSGVNFVLANERILKIGFQTVGIDVLNSTVEQLNSEQKAWLSVRLIELKADIENLYIKKNLNAAYTATLITALMDINKDLNIAEDEEKVQSSVRQRPQQSARLLNSRQSDYSYSYSSGTSRGSSGILGSVLNYQGYSDASNGNVNLPLMFLSTDYQNGVSTEYAVECCVGCCESCGKMSCDCCKGSEECCKGLMTSCGICLVGAFKILTCQSDNGDNPSASATSTGAAGPLYNFQNVTQTAVGSSVMAAELSSTGASAVAKHATHFSTTVGVGFGASVALLTVGNALRALVTPFADCRRGLLARGFTEFCTSYLSSAGASYATYKNYEGGPLDAAMVASVTLALSHTLNTVAFNAYNRKHYMKISNPENWLLTSEELKNTVDFTIKISQPEACLLQSNILRCF